MNARHRPPAFRGAGNASAAAWLAGMTLAALAVAGAPTGAYAWGVEPRRHHLTASIGYAQYIQEEMGWSAEHAEKGYSGGFSYRYSLSPRFDVGFVGRFITTELSGFESDGIVLRRVGEAESDWMGPLVRYNFSTSGFRPYIEGEFLLVDESYNYEENEAAVSYTWSGIGAGLAAGVEIPFGPGFTLPIEVRYLFGQPEEDVSNLGFEMGATVHFGRIPGTPAPEEAPRPAPEGAKE